MSDHLLTMACTGSVGDVLERLQRALAEQNVALFAVIDHAAAAREAGLQLADEVLAIFGNPAVGTALMQRDPASGIDLPLKLLIWDDQGTTRIGYLPPTALADRYDLEPVAPVLDKLTAFLVNLSRAVA